MNDLPAVVAWIVALGLALLVALLLRALRRLPTPGAPRWCCRAVGWTVAAAVLGPIVVVPTIYLIGMLIDWRGLLAHPGEAIAFAIGGTLYLGFWYLFVSLAFFALPYMPVLVLWARLGPRLGRLERTRGGIVASAGLLAVPGALVAVVAYGVLDEPFGYHGAELVKFGAWILVATAVSLLVPRLVIPALRPGVFAGAPGGGAAAETH